MKRLVLVMLAACAAHGPPPLPTHAETTKHAVPRAWIEDDYARALAEAKKDDAPLFVDASAVWCHTCKAMRAFVLDDASLPSGFVRFSFDVEKDQNAAAAAAFPVHVLPTFFVVDARDGSIHGRWEGAGSVAQMRAFMTDAARSIAMAHGTNAPFGRSAAPSARTSGELRPDDPLALLLAGHRAALKNDAAESEKNFSAALAHAPRGWDHETEAMLGLLKARRHSPAGCAETAENALAETPSRLGRSSLAADYADEALDCVQKDHDARARHVRELVAKNVADLARDAGAPLSPDDRSDAWRIVWEARESLGDHAGALDAARARLDVIMKAVAAQPDPARTTTFDGARMETLEFLGRPEDAARFLEAQEKALPDDYNPAHRLARVYFDMKKYPEALAAIDRAIAKGYGARKGLMLRLKADVLIAMGNKPEARKTLEEQLALYRSLPDGEKKPSFEKAVQKRIDELK